MEQIKIKYLRDIPKIKKIVKGDWIDLCCAEDVYISRHEYKEIPLGIAMKLPQGYEALVAPRSSTFKRYKLLLGNSIGVIDNTYSGDTDEWKFPAYAIDGTFIPKGTRICQFRIIKNQPEIEFKEVEHLDDVARGGLGSTGI